MKWQLIIDRNPLKGSLNMAIDEFVFLEIQERENTILRFYQWEKPAISLGYSQKIKEVINLAFVKEEDLDVVRRITGGKVVLHNKEITYSLASSDSEIFSDSLLKSYKLISQALCLGLEKMGIKASMSPETYSSFAQKNLPCFSFPARDEIHVGGRKLIGSAQKRIKKSFLQHGSIPLINDLNLLAGATFYPRDDLKSKIISLNQALGKKMNFSQAVNFLIQGFSEFFKIEFEPKIFNSKEMGQIYELQKNKYENKNWTFHF